MACYTQEEIAEREGISVQPIKDVISDFSENLPENLKSIASYTADYEWPLFNVVDEFTNAINSNQFSATFEPSR